MSAVIKNWKLGDIALARMCKKVLAKVQIIKDEKGLFFDYKVLAITGNEDGSVLMTKELCYYVETCRSNQRLWLPYTCLHLASRSRPFYGTDKISPPKVNQPKSNTPRKRKICEEITLPLEVKISKQKEPDFNTTYDIKHIPLRQGRSENSFKEFVRRSKEMIFDDYFHVLQSSKGCEDILDYLFNVDASTEDKIEAVLKDIATEKEVENYLHQCWRFNFVHKMEKRDNALNSNSVILEKMPITLHTPWCLVCGKTEKLRECPNCPSSYHPVCRREWLTSILHRKNPPQKPQKPTTFVQKILSSTRTICSVKKDKENIELCPSCMWGPRIGYDDMVWHKLGTCAWWPARVLTPGSTPPCLLARTHSPHEWPLRYYGTENHSWGNISRMCLFLPTHTSALAPGRDPMLQKAIMDACDDYIAVYLK